VKNVVGGTRRVFPKFVEVDYQLRLLSMSIGGVPSME